MHKQFLCTKQFPTKPLSLTSWKYLFSVRITKQSGKQEWLCSWAVVVYWAYSEPTSLWHWKFPWAGLEIKKIFRSPFGDKLEKCSRQVQIFSRQFVWCKWSSSQYQLGFWYLARSLSREFQVNLQNPVKFTIMCEIPRNSREILSNTCRYNIFETYLGYWGCLIAENLQIYLETLSP